MNPMMQSAPVATETTGVSHVQLKQCLKHFLSKPSAMPRIDPKYGTKYPGECSLLHFVIYAVLRGKDPRRCVHLATSEKYQSAWASLCVTSTSQSWGYGDSAVRSILDTVFFGAVSPDMWQRAMKNAQTAFN